MARIPQSRLGGCTGFYAQGPFRWITLGGGDKRATTLTHGREAQGNLIFAGSFGGTAKFGDATITSGGSNDLYGAKLKVK